MIIIQKLSDMIEEEMNDAEKYARCALEWKDERPALAEAFYKLANEEMGHANILHDQVVAIIADYRKKEGNPPDVMLKLYEILHKKHINRAASVKGMISLFKEK